MGYQTVKSVIKAMNILELLTDQAVENKTLTLADIARATGILPVTARNLLRTLEECGYARRTGHGRYEEGPRCCRLFRAEGILRQLRDCAAPVVEQCVADLGESVLLAAIVRGRRIELLRRQCVDDRLVEPQWQANANFYRMRSTRAILAWFSGEQLASFVSANGLPSLEDWPECHGTEEGLREELRRIRRDGGCCDRLECMVAFAVPVLTAADEAVASLGCYAPVSRTDKARAAGIMQLLHQCAARIREELGRKP